ncbi:MAG: pyridoxamine 5'-phosphate oxidase family protein [Acetobacteraceae bacterium]|nr:pyridoxamine 5'-phosphate oxidase family protein [Acetobacteraceae bacterium]
MSGIADQAALRDHIGPISPLAERKVLPRLDAHCRRFIELSPFLVMATADTEGNVDASPRGDPPGFVRVIDDATLIIPDRPGNNRVDSFSNLLASPGVGLIFFVPGVDETLRVNGVARVTDDPALLSPSAIGAKQPRTGLAVEIREAFFHCGKALKRSRLWNADAQIDRRSFPTLGRIIADQIGNISVADADERIERAYTERLY